MSKLEKIASQGPKTMPQTPQITPEMEALQKKAKPLGVASMLGGAAAGYTTYKTILSGLGYLAIPAAVGIGLGTAALLGTAAKAYLMRTKEGKKVKEQVDTVKKQYQMQPAYQ